MSGTEERRRLAGALGAAAALAVAGGASAQQYVVLGWNDLGMHCMQPDYSELMILPPFNTLHAQVIRRGSEPDLISGGVTVRYWFPGNTHSADKNNFWEHPQAALGTPLPNIGVAGKGMSGTMSSGPARDWSAVGIPIVPIDDLGRESPYNLAVISVSAGGQVVAQTRAVVPTATEMSCFICHDIGGQSTATGILSAHDRLHGTTLMAQRPVLCAGCHADNALGLPGQAGVPNLSSAMHTAHAPRMGLAGLANECYACHPGVRTSCQRDVHSASAMTCTDCHGGMLAVGSPSRNPWVDMPRCATCHTRAGFDFEPPGVLFRNAVGHGGVQCAACHSSPHAVTPAVTPIDNVQANLRQGHAGVINTCTVCHTQTPSEGFEHRYEP